MPAGTQPLMPNHVYYYRLCIYSKAFSFIPYISVLVLLPGFCPGVCRPILRCVEQLMMIWGCSYFDHHTHLSSSLGDDPAWTSVPGQGTVPTGVPRGIWWAPPPAYWWPRVWLPGTTFPTRGCLTLSHVSAWGNDHLQPVSQ